MLGKELDRLIVKIMGDAAQYEKTLDQIEQQTGKVFGNIKDLGQKMMFGLTAPLVGFGALAVNEFAKFDDAMTKSLAIMGKVNGDMRKQMEDTARTISKEGVSGPEKVAESYYFLASAGFDAASAMKALPVVDRFATAAAMDHAKATELLTDSQAALGLAVKDPTQRMLQMTRVSDVLTEAGNRSNASAEQFAKALTTKSAVAMRGLNKEIEEGVAVLGVYADQGIKGEMAGEKFSIMLREIKTASTGKNADFWKTMGISGFDEKTGQFGHVADIIGGLEKKMKGMTDAQKFATLQMLGFRSESIDAISPLIGLSGKIREYETALKSAGGATQSVAEEQMKSFSSQMANLWNNVSDLGITIGTVLAPYLKMAADYVRDAVAQFGQLSAGMQKFIVFSALIAAAAGPVIYAIGVMVPGFFAILKGVTSLWAVTQTLFTFFVSWGMKAVGVLMMINPWVLVIGAAIGIVTALIVGPDGLAAAWDWVKQVAENFFSNIVGFLANFSHNFNAITVWLGENWWNLIKDMGLVILGFLTTLPKNAMATVTVMMRLFSVFVGWLTGIFSMAFNYVFSKEFVDMIVNGISRAIDAFSGFVSYIWDQFVQFCKEAASWFMSIFETEKKEGKSAEEAKAIATQRTKDQIATTKETFGETLATDFEKAKRGDGLLKTMGGVLAEDNGFVSPTAGIDFNTKAGPDLKFDRGTDIVKKAVTDPATLEPIVAEATDASKSAAMLEEQKNKKKKKDGQREGESDNSATFAFSKEAYSILNQAASYTSEAMKTTTAAGPMNLTGAATSGAVKAGPPGMKAPSVPAAAESSYAGVRSSDPIKQTAEAGVAQLSELKEQTKILKLISDNTKGGSGGGTFTIDGDA